MECCHGTTRMRVMLATPIADNLPWSARFYARVVQQGASSFSPNICSLGVSNRLLGHRPVTGKYPIRAHDDQ